MNLNRSVRYLMVALLVMTAGCSTDGEGLNSSEQANAGLTVDGVAQSGGGDDNASIETAVVSDDIPASDAPPEPAGELGRLPALDEGEISPPPDDSEEEAAAANTLELATDEVGAELVEGSDDGVSIGIEVAPVGDEPVELQVEPESLIDGQGIDIDLNRQILDDENNRAIVTFTMPVGMRPQREHQRTFNITASSGDVTETKSITLDIMPVDSPDVYLIIGQSNMVGSSEEDARELTPGGADERNSRIWQLNVTHNDINLFDDIEDFTREDKIAVEPRFVQAQDPLHHPLRVGRDQKKATQIGAGLSFAKSALNDTSQQIYLVPAAWGASAFCNVLGGELGWNAEETNDAALGGTGLVDRAIARLNMTLEDTGGVFRGILWHQGESDSGRSACAQSYAENLVSMVERIRTDAAEDVRGSSARGLEAPVPFIVGTMSKGEDARGDFSSWSENKEQVDSVHRQVTELIPFADWVNNDDLIPSAYPCGTGSCIHFGSEALREMGQRYFQALERVWESQ